MMKRITGCLLFVFLLFSSCCCCQKCDSVPWSSKDLKWRYFKGKPDPTSSSAALSEIHIYYHFLTSAKTAEIEMTCSFAMCESWVKTGVGGRLLVHEQTHFDIAEYFRRLMAKEILDQKLSHANITEKFETIGTLVNRLRRETDALYDLETNHSLIEDKQKEWTKKVHKLLKQLDNYEKNAYRVILN